MMIECECRVELAGHRIIHCPKHAAADDLLEALEKIVGLTPISNDKVALLITGEAIQKVAEDAIARATKEAE